MEYWNTPLWMENPWPRQLDQALARIRRHGSLIALGLALGLLNGSPHTHRHSALAVRTDMADALRSARPFEGRLEGVSHVPFDPAAAVGEASLMRVFRRVRGLSEILPEDELLAVQGFAQLVSGNAGAAVATLEEAVRDRASAQGFNDLAVAYLARAQSMPRAYDLILALEAASRALELEPGLPAALFNRALVLESLGLVFESRRRWSEVASRETRYGWRQEAAKRLARAEQSPAAVRWQDELPVLLRAAEDGETGVARQIVSAHPQKTRRLAQDELFSRWAEAALSGDSGQARASLRVLRLIGGALAEQVGERSVADAVARIDVVEQRSLLHRRLAEGHLAYAEGVESYEALRPEDALHQLRRARENLDAAGSPAALWAEYWEAVAEFYLDRLPVVLPTFDALLADPRQGRYPALAGRTLWARGLVRYVQLDLGSALTDFEAAVVSFTELGETENVGAVARMVGAVYDRLGDSEKAWAWRVEALRALRDDPESVWRAGLLLMSTRALLRDGRPGVALLFQDEGLETAQLRGAAEELTEAHLARGRILMELDQPAAAARDFAAAREALAGVTSTAIHRRLRHDADIADAHAHLDRDPAAVIPALSEAIRFYAEDSGRDLQVAFASLLRARAYLALGEDALAEEDLRHGIRKFEGVRDALAGDHRRTLFFEQWQPLFDELIVLESSRRNRPEEALAWAERARSGFLDAAGPAPRPALPLATWQRQIPDGTAMLFYAILPDRLLTWVVDRTRVRPLTLELSQQRLARLVFELRDGLHGSAAWAGPAPNAAAELFDLVVRPALETLAPSTQLVVVPDKELNAVPFSALYDRREGRYLVESHALSLVPSASSYARLRQRSPFASAPASWRVLAIGDPAFEATSAPTLGPLPGARREAAEVAALYPRSTTLLAAEATARRMLEELPRHGVLHFAGHALDQPQDPAKSRLLLATAERGAGALRGAEILAVDLSHLRLAVLSACQTSPGSARRSGGVSGLARAFLLAGVPAVVATLWNVEDSAARHLLPEFHRRLLAGESGAQALRAAQQRLLAATDGGLRHPAHWAAFQLIGVLEPNPLIFNSKESKP